MSSMKISVIVPVYNIRDYISCCLDSLIAQEYRDLEIICVDDGSTDGTANLLDGYSEVDSRIRVIHKTNGGVTSARLCGVSASTGEWVGFVDGDDYVEPEMYARLIENALKYDADISHCGYRMVFADRVDYYFNTGTLQVQSGYEAVKELLVGQIEPGLCNKLFRRELLINMMENTPVDPTIRINEDLLINYFLFRKAKVTVLEDICPYHYRVRAGSAATSPVNLHKIEDPLKVRKILFRETIGDRILNDLCLQDLNRQLIRTASRNASKYTPEIKELILKARRELKETSLQLFRHSDATYKLKLQALFAAALPNAYRTIHHVYGELTGKNHKYDIKRSK